MCNPEKTKAEKASDILSNKGIDKCCEWLLDNGGYKILHVPGVNISPDTERAHNAYKSRVFFYDGKIYDMRYENLSEGEAFYPDDTLFSSGDFILRIDSQIVLHTSFFRERKAFQDTITIGTYGIKKTVLGEWLEVIPRLVAKAKEIEAAQEAAKKEEESRKLDDNIDLGEYE